MRERESRRENERMGEGGICTKFKVESVALDFTLMLESFFSPGYGSNCRVAKNI